MWNTLFGRVISAVAQSLTVAQPTPAAATPSAPAAEEQPPIQEGASQLTAAPASPDVAAAVARLEAEAAARKSLPRRRHTSKSPRRSRDRRRSPLSNASALRSRSNTRDDGPR